MLRSDVIVDIYPFFFLNNYGWRLSYIVYNIYILLSLFIMVACFALFSVYLLSFTRLLSSLTLLRTVFCASVIERYTHMVYIL